VEIYLDNAATTQCYFEVAELVLKVMCEDYANPSSVHLKGMEAERYVKDGKAKLAHRLKVEPKEIIFTSGGTESDNLAILGGAFANQRRGKHLITTVIEHSGILKAMQHLEEVGFQVTYLPVDQDGIVDLQALQEALRLDTILVSIMHVNNEIGTIQPLEQIGTIIKDYNKQILFHSDGVQGFGKVPIYPKRVSLDLYSVSAHKFHGPKGIGFLYKNEKAKILPISYGGGQQGGFRAGTDNVPGIAGLVLAGEKMYQNMEVNKAHVWALKQGFIAGLQKIEDVRFHGDCVDPDKSVGHIISVGFKGVRSEVLLHALEEKKIFVSAGSACSSYSKKTSSVLAALSLPEGYQESTIRFSLSEFTTKEEIDVTLETLYNVIPMLRKFIAR